MADYVPKEVLSMAKSDQLEISVRIGRSGISEAFLGELSEQLDKRRLVKVKANRGAVRGSSERAELFEGLAAATNSMLVFQRGNVAVFWFD
uniref:Putative RNA-binding protein n=1 Tax=uncultured marine group II/III euryarchaeote AD1000_31_D05 TaxID=1457753 RepID=A0A075FN74_9EURY|nr:putative RNA-binding protein [uncultured marine group II/III euryarchaeote AD1000_31_D05]